jgi:hypothetical protein
VNDSNAKDKRSDGDPVLRAADVIPPFNQSASSRDDPEGEPRDRVNGESELQSARRVAGHRRSRRVASPGESKEQLAKPKAAPQVPQYDLAEHILATHRQTTARKRRAPTELQDTGEPVQVRTRTDIPMAGASEQERRALHAIVADIVARDIARLSRGISPAAPR